MKKVFEALWGFFFWGNIFPFIDDNSLPVYVGSILVAMAFVWNFFTPYATIFTIILVACVLNTMFWLQEKDNAEYKKHAKTFCIAHDIFLGLAIVIACFVKIDLAIYTFCFIALLQLIIWLNDVFFTLSTISQKDVLAKIYKVFGIACDIMSIIFPAILAISFIVLCAKLPVSATAKIGFIATYFTVIPIISEYQDAWLGSSIPGIIFFKESDECLEYMDDDDE